MSGVGARLVAAVALVALCGAAADAVQDDYSSPKLRVDWTEFKKLYDAGSVVVVDVRGTDAYEAGHIPRAMSVPLDQVEARTDELKELGKPVVFYCA